MGVGVERSDMSPTLHSSSLYLLLVRLCPFGSHGTRRAPGSLDLPALSSHSADFIVESSPLSSHDDATGASISQVLPICKLLDADKRMIYLRNICLEKYHTLFRELTIPLLIYSVFEKWW